MQPRSRRWLADIIRYSNRICDVTTDRTLADYLDDEFLRDIVERNLLRVGELIVRLREHDLPVAERLTQYRGIIGLRNVLSHDYESISDERIWMLLDQALPVLISDAERLLDKEDSPADAD